MLFASGAATESLEDSTTVRLLIRVRAIGTSTLHQDNAAMDPTTYKKI